MGFTVALANGLRLSFSLGGRAGKGGGLDAGLGGGGFDGLLGCEVEANFVGLFAGETGGGPLGLGGGPLGLGGKGGGTGDVSVL